MALVLPLPRARNLLGFVLALGACASDSGDDSSSTSSGTGSESTTAGPTTAMTVDTTATTTVETTATDTSADASTSSGGADSTTSDEASGSDLSSTGAASCGDGTRDPGELCDDGNAADDDTCRNGCAEIVLDFDTDPAGDPIPAGTMLDDFYADALELTFTRAGGGDCGQGDSVFASDDHYPDDWGTQPNVVSTCSPPSSSDIATDFQGSIEIVFTTLEPTQACVFFWAEDQDSQGFIRALDDQEAMIDESIADAGVTGELCVSAAGMRAVVLGGLGMTYVRIDDVRLLAE